MKPIMSDGNKAGGRQRKSTRRSSILKQRQDTCILSEATEVTERFNSPSRRRVSFASTATVRTFETLPWRSYTDDSGSKSVNHIENDDVFGPQPSLLVQPKYPSASVVPPVVDGNAGISAPFNGDQVSVKEQDKTIMFSDFNESNCAMEITTNVSQLSHSWFDNDDSYLENNQKDVDVIQGPIVGDSDNEVEPRVIFPWNNKGPGGNEVEKTQIFLSSDDDNNMEFTHNLTGFPSVSERALKSPEYEYIIPHKENFPKNLTDDHRMVDEMTADMEMTDIIGHVSVPVPNRSVLVDLTEDKNLTPIQEMSVSSLYVSDHKPNNSQDKGLDFSQVCARLEAIESGKKHLHSDENQMDVTAKSNSLFASPPSRVSCKESLPHADKQDEDDLEVSFNFRPSVGSSPNTSQSKKPFPFVRYTFKNSLIGERLPAQDSSFSSQNQKTLFTANMDISEDESSPLHSTNAAHGNLNGIHIEDKMSHESEQTLFDVDMEMTNTHLVDDISHGQRMESQESGKTSMQAEEKDVLVISSVSGKNKIWQGTVSSLDSSRQQNDLQAVKENASGIRGDNPGEQKEDLSRNTIYNMGDMEFTHCIDVKETNSNRGQIQKTVESFSSSQGHDAGRSDSPQMTVCHTEDMNFTCDIVDSRKRDRTMDIKESGGGGVEKTVFVGEMEMTCDLSQRISDEAKDVCQGAAPSQNCDSIESVSQYNAVMERDSSRLESKSCLGDREKAESLNVSLLDKFLGSQEMSFHQSIIGDAVDDNESLHDSISLSEIANMKSPKESKNEKRASNVSSPLYDGDQQSRQSSAEKSSNQSIIDCKNTSSLKTDHQKSSPIEVKLSFENMEDGGYSGSQQEFDQSARLNSDEEESLHDSISLSDIAGLKSPPKQSQMLENGSKSSSFVSSKSETSPIPGQNHNMTKDASPIEEVKFVDAENHKVSPKKNSQLSEQDKKKEALRKSICSEMMFPNLGSKSYIAKSFSHHSKPNTVVVTKANHEHAESEVLSKRDLEERLCDPSESTEGESEESESRRNTQQRLESMGLSGFFEGEGKLNDVDCPELADHSDIDPPLDDSVQEELVFSYMRSIIEPVGDDADDKDVKPVEESSRERLEFSDICQVLEIECEAEQGQQITPKLVPSANISDKLSASLLVEPEIATLEDWIAKLQMEVSRKKQMVKEDLEAFGTNPPQIYKDMRRAASQQHNVSSIKSKVHEMARACKGSVRSKHNRRKADYYRELTTAHQKKHSQQERDLDTILSDIERVANVSAEIDKCMEDLNVLSDTRSEIHQLEKKKGEIESETCQMRSHCNKLDTEIDKLNETARNCLHKIKEDEDKELLLLDKISFISCLSEWSLLKQSTTQQTFAFLSNTLILNVSLSHTKTPQTISDISFRSRLSSKSTVWARISHQLLLSSLNREDLMNKFPHSGHLNLLLAHVSEMCGVSRDFCSELKDVDMKHHLSGEGLRIRVQLLSHDCHQSLEVTTTLQPGSYPTQPLDWDANILLSPLSSASVVDVLKHVVPGDKYISRSIEAVYSLMAR